MTKTKIKDFEVTTAEAEKALGLSTGYLLCSTKHKIPYRIGSDGKRWVWASDVIIALRSSTPRVMSAKLEVAAMNRPS